MILFMRTVFLIIILMPFCIVGETYGVSLADLMNKPGSIASDDVTFSNFTGTFGPAPSSLIPPEGCCHFPTIADINIEPSAGAGFTINGIDLSGSWSRAATLGIPSELWYQLL